MECFRLVECMKKKHFNYKHGMCKTKFYGIWRGILSRCNDKNCDKYKHYGGRGIKCLWKSFEEFRDDMYDSYLKHFKKYSSRNTTIDRVDNNGDYCRRNCKWTNRKAQANNRRSNCFISYKNEIKTLAEWAEILPFEYHTLKARLNKYGWSVEEAFTIPAKLGSNQNLRKIPVNNSPLTDTLICANINL